MICGGAEGVFWEGALSQFTQNKTQLTWPGFLLPAYKWMIRNHSLHASSRAHRW